MPDDQDSRKPHLRHIKMLLITAVLLAISTLSITAYPHAEPGSIHSLSITNSKRGVTHHLEPFTNTTLTTRAEKGVCTDLELPTEVQYKIGYEHFCEKYVCADCKMRMGTTEKPIVATYMLKTHIGTTIPWIFKISSDAWGGSIFYLQRNMCLAGFRNMLEGEKAKAGENYCVVDGTGGNGESKEFWGQGFVLIVGSRMKFEGREDVNNGFSYETRRRKGEFDPNNPNGKRV